MSDVDLKRRRGGFKATITKTLNDIYQLVTGKQEGTLDPSQDQFDAKFDAIDTLLKHVDQTQEELLKLSDDNTAEAAETEGEAYVAVIRAEVADALTHVTAAMKPTEEEQREPKVIVKPEDSASHVPSRAPSRVSSVSSAKAKAAATAAALAVAAARLKDMQNLQQEELALKQKKEALELTTQLAVAEAERDVYEQLENENQRGHSQVLPPVSQIPSQVLPPARQRPVRLPSPSPAPRITAQTATYPDDDNQTSEKASPGRSPSMTEMLVNNQQQQQKMLDTMRLPKIELSQFNGDPLQYWLFVKQFDNNLCSNVDEGSKLLLLLQYCVGKARKVIECCAAMEPAVGYAKARYLLKERFGNEFIIAETWVSKVADGPSIAVKDKGAIQDLSDDLTNCVENLKAMELLGEANTQSVLLKIVERLPSFLKNRWLSEVHRIRKRSHRNPDITDLMKFVEDAATECNDPIYGRLADNSRNRPSTNRGKASFNITVDNKPKQEWPPCSICHDQHTLFGCHKFKEMPTDDRRKYAMEQKLCFNCLKPGHNAQKCRLNRTCSVPGCNKKHTKFLHPLQKHDTNQSGQSHNTNTDQAQATCSATGAGINRVALPVIPVKVRAASSGEVLTVHALLDSGSTNTFISEGLVRNLDLKGEEQTLTLTTLDKTDNQVQTSVVNLEVAAMDSNTYLPLENVYSRRSIPVNDSNVGKSHDISKWPHLRELNIPRVNVTSVQLLIGQDQPDLLLPRDVRSGGKGTPYATRTLLGWTINGPLGLPHRSYQPSATSNLICTDNSLQEQVERFWKVDDWESILDRGPNISLEDKQAVDIWERSIKQDDSDHYVLDIPFRNQSPELPCNRILAENRLRGLKKRLHRNSDLHKAYTAGMDSLLDKGYAEKVDNSPKEGMTWYLPHHPVFNPKKPGKLRIVFDCAAKQDGISLNDKVLQGPDMTNTLLGVLLRFRQEPVGVMADIESMFHQVHVPQEQRDCLRFLWWPGGDMEKIPEEYRMISHLFGGTWSPSCCSFALQQTAKDNTHRYSQDTVNRVAHDFYVDDCLTSVPDEEQAVTVVAELTDLLRQGGFNLTKWSSNSRPVLSSVPKDSRSKEVKDIDLNHAALPVERALGVCWSPEEDCFTYSIQLPDKPLTRRGLLSSVSTIYDPLGFLSPFTLPAKKIIQDLTRQKIGWDDPLPEDERQRWLNWAKDLPKLVRLTVPRCYSQNSSQVTRYELHIFSDASERAYGVVGYLRTIHKDTVSLSLVLAKCRLAPLRNMTIPRLELAAAALAVKIDGVLRRELDLPLEETVFWTDSTIVLSYITNASKRFQTYVANRISAIHEGSTVKQWRHIPSHSNPADDISRGLSADEIINSSRWISGPPFLLQDKASWPSNVAIADISEDDPEVKQQKRSAKAYLAEVATPPPMDDLLKRYSSWYKLRRGIAWMNRFKVWLASKWRKQTYIKPDNELSMEELNLAEEDIARYVQHQSFDLAITLKGSPLHKLQPTISEKGLLCVGGRLRRAKLPDHQRHPIILPNSHHVVDLIIKSRHESSAHSGREHVLSTVRQRYWIISGRQAVKRVLRKCFVCRRSKSSTACQRMADLPSCRLNSDHPPFSHVGVDMFGPFIVRRGRSDIKRYGCLFTCMTMRAIHLEITHSMDTDSFINALQRFISRRGHPKQIWCDNGTNFVGAQHELERSNTKIHRFLLQQDIAWHFNPPRASHMGGAWERMIRTVRKTLQPLLKEQTLDDEGLNTLFCLVESIVNSRPLTAVSDDPEDMNALTPNHILLPGSTPQLPPGVFSSTDMYVRRRWRQVQHLIDVFWRRWTREYLPVLQARTKWLKEERNITVGDIVLLVEDSPRNTWPLARIVDVFPGDDGLVRSVKLKTRNSIFLRPITKVCLLEAANKSS